MPSLPEDHVIALRSLTMENAIRFWDGLEAAGRKEKTLNAVVRELCRADLFYLLVRACRRVDMLHPWVYARCREVEESPNNHLDLWSRGHFKSSLITFGLTIQDILKDPNVTIGIFSHTRPIAKAFLRQIMRELEGNAVLHSAFPDVLWGKDVRQAPKWSEDDGIIVRRSSNPPEATVEAWGLVDGQPTGKHFKRVVYDDVVVEGSVSNPEMIKKTDTAVEQSLNLVHEDFALRFAGTRWKFSDSYRMVMDRGIAKPRIHACTDDGTENGNPVFWTPEVMAFKRQSMGIFTFSAQCLLNPKADALQGFKREWVHTYTKISHPERMNKYLLIDAASSKKKGSDYTAMWVIGLATDGNYYALDMVRDRLNLTERADRVFALHRKWKPKQVRYEKYGLMADIEHIKSRMETETYRFDITEVGGQTKKEDRIGRLIPIFEQGRFYLPKSFHVTDYQKVVRDLVRDFVEEELVAFPVGIHDDALDALARIAEPDLKLTWPQESKTDIDPPRREYSPGQASVSWMGV